MLGWIVKRQSSEHIDKNFPESQAAAIFVQLLPENLELSLFMNFFKPRRWLLAFLLSKHLFLCLYSNVSEKDSATDSDYRI